MTRTPELSIPDFQERYRVLLDIGRILTGTLEADQLYRTIYEQASRVLETTGFYVSLYDAETDQATVAFFADRGEIERPGVTYPGSRSRAIREARPVLEELDEPDRAVMLLGPESDKELTRSIISAPLLREGQVMGVISAQSYHRNAYNSDDLELLLAVADLAAVAVYNVRTVEELERQRSESERLEAIGRELAASLETSEVLDRIAAGVRSLSHADAAGVWLLGADRRLELVVTDGEAPLAEGTEVTLPESMIERVVQDPTPIPLHMTEEHPLVPEELRAVLEKEYALAVPLIAEQRLVGVFAVGHRSHPTPSADRSVILQRFAHQAAIALSNARLHEQIRLLSMTDPLTDLPNRRHMKMFLEKEFAAAERGRPLAVTMYDLNDFKQYNDEHGHQAGDAALKRFGRILVNETRAMNLAARYGGDEFVTILSDTDREGGAMHAGRVMKAVRADDLMAGIGASAGIATYEPGMKTPDDLIRKADERLYQAKSDRGKTAAH